MGLLHDQLGFFHHFNEVVESYSIYMKLPY